MKRILTDVQQPELVLDRKSRFFMTMESVIRSAVDDIEKQFFHTELIKNTNCITNMYLTLHPREMNHSFMQHIKKLSQEGSGPNASDVQQNNPRDGETKASASLQPPANTIDNKSPINIEKIKNDAVLLIMKGILADVQQTELFSDQSSKFFVAMKNAVRSAVDNVEKHFYSSEPITNVFAILNKYPKLYPRERNHSFMEEIKRSLQEGPEAKASVIEENAPQDLQSKKAASVQPPAYTKIYTDPITEKIINNAVLVIIKDLLTDVKQPLDENSQFFVTLKKVIRIAVDNVVSVFCRYRPPRDIFFILVKYPKLYPRDRNQSLMQEIKQYLQDGPGAKMPSPEVNSSTFKYLIPAIECSDVNRPYLNKALLENAKNMDVTEIVSRTFSFVRRSHLLSNSEIREAVCRDVRIRVEEIIDKLAQYSAKVKNKKIISTYFEKYPLDITAVRKFIYMSTRGIASNFNSQLRQELQPSELDQTNHSPTSVMSDDVKSAKEKAKERIINNLLSLVTDAHLLNDREFYNKFYTTLNRVVEKRLDRCITVSFNGIFHLRANDLMSEYGKLFNPRNVQPFTEALKSLAQPAYPLTGKIPNTGVQSDTIESHDSSLENMSEEQMAELLQELKINKSTDKVTHLTLSYARMTDSSLETDTPLYTAMRKIIRLRVEDIVKKNTRFSCTRVAVCYQNKFPLRTGVQALIAQAQAILDSVSNLQNDKKCVENVKPEPENVAMVTDSIEDHKETKMDTVVNDDELTNAKSTVIPSFEGTSIAQVKDGDRTGSPRVASVESQFGSSDDTYSRVDSVKEDNEMKTNFSTTSESGNNNIARKSEEHLNKCSNVTEKKEDTIVNIEINADNESIKMVTENVVVNSTNQETDTNISKSICTENNIKDNNTCIPIVGAGDIDSGQLEIEKPTFESIEIRIDNSRESRDLSNIILSVTNRTYTANEIDSKESHKCVESIKPEVSNLALVTDSKEVFEENKTDLHILDAELIVNKFIVKDTSVSQSEDADKSGPWLAASDELQLCSSNDTSNLVDGVKEDKTNLDKTATLSYDGSTNNSINEKVSRNVTESKEETIVNMETSAYNESMNMLLENELAQNSTNEVTDTKSPKTICTEKTNNDDNTPIVGAGDIQIVSEQPEKDKATTTEIRMDGSEESRDLCNIAFRISNSNANTSANKIDSKDLQNDRECVESKKTEVENVAMATDYIEDIKENKTDVDMYHDELINKKSIAMDSFEYTDAARIEDADKTGSLNLASVESQLCSSDETFKRVDSVNEENEMGIDVSATSKSEQLVNTDDQNLKNDYNTRANNLTEMDKTRTLSYEDSTNININEEISSNVTGSKEDTTVNMEISADNESKKMLPENLVADNTINEETDTNSLKSICTENTINDNNTCTPVVGAGDNLVSEQPEYKKSPNKTTEIIIDNSKESRNLGDLSTAIIDIHVSTAVIKTDYENILKSKEDTENCEIDKDIRVHDGEQINEKSMVIDTFENTNDVTEKEGSLPTVVGSQICNSDDASNPVDNVEDDNRKETIITTTDKFAEEVSTNDKSSGNLNINIMETDAHNITDIDKSGTLCYDSTQNIIEDTSSNDSTNKEDSAVNMEISVDKESMNVVPENIVDDNSTNQETDTNSPKINCDEETIADNTNNTCTETIGASDINIVTEQSENDKTSL